MGQESWKVFRDGLNLVFLWDLLIVTHITLLPALSFTEMLLWTCPYYTEELQNIFAANLRKMFRTVQHCSLDQKGSLVGKKGKESLYSV